MNVVAGLNSFKNQGVDVFIKAMNYKRLRTLSVHHDDRYFMANACDDVEEYLEKLIDKIKMRFELYKRHADPEDVHIIIDDAEYLLTPENQVLLSYEIVNLVKEGYNFILSSNSPYVIEALNKKSKEEKVDNSSRFYMYDKDKKIIKDETNNKGKIFRELSKPFEKLIFDK